MPMTTAQLFTSSEAVTDLLWPRLRRFFPSLRSIEQIDIHSLGSVQAGRGVIRLKLSVRTVAKRQKQLELYVNYDERGSSESIFRFLQKLQRAGFGSGVYGAPQPLWYDRAHHFFVYVPFAGDRIRDLLEQGRLTQKQLMLSVQHTAHWLHRFHQLPGGAAPKKVIRVQSTSLTLLPRTFQSRAQQHLAHLNQLLAAPRRLHLVHGDPHLANCISSGKNSFACIDFSESYAGSPVADVAMFLVHLDVALRAHISIAAIRKTQEHFLTAYYGQSGLTITPSLRQSIIAHQVYTALVFLSFTQDHHHRPSPSIRAILLRLQRIVDLGLKELDSDSATIVLAS